MYGNIRVPTGRTKMDRGGESRESWLRALLWWSLLFELASGGNNFSDLLSSMKTNGAFSARVLISLTNEHVG